MTDLKPDANVIYDALSLWFRESYSGEIEIGWRDPQSGSLNRFKRFQLDDIESLATFAADTNSVPGANIYFRCATVNPGTMPATDNDVCMVPGLWMDADDEGAVHRLHTNPLIHRPAFITVTGRQPELRAQAFWLFSEPTMLTDKVRQMNKMLATHFGGDPAVTNPGRLMRIPGSVAWPVKEGRTTAELTQWLQPKDNRQTHVPIHAWGHLLNQHQPPPQESSIDAAPPETGFYVDTGRTNVSIADLYRETKINGAWHNSTLKMVASWVNRGFSDLEIRMMAAALTQPGFTVQQTLAEIDTMIKGAREKWGITNPDPLADEAAAKAVSIWSDEEVAISDIPPRPWIVPGFLMRGSVTLLSGQGAGGKSSFSVGVSLAMAAGQPYGRYESGKPLKTVYYNVEDDMDEQRRRYSAALIASGHQPEALRAVIRTGPDTIGTLFRRDPKTNEIVPTVAMAQLEKLIQEKGADVLIVDPLAELHDQDENDNTAMRAVLAAFRALAKRLNIAVCILHHDRKGVGAAGDMDRMRGASALSGAARVVLTLTKMTEEEAARFEIDPLQRKSYFRIDSAKSNYAPPEEAHWYELRGIEIPNGETIAAAIPWTPPAVAAPLSKISRQDIVEVLEAVKKAPADERRKDVRSEDWVGRIMMRMKPWDEQTTKALINSLLKSGAMVTQHIKDEHRKDRTVIGVDETIFLEIRAEVENAWSEKDE